MSKIHLIYKVPRRGGIVGRIFDKIFLTLPWIVPTWRYGLFIPWRKPIKAPHSISYNLLKALKLHSKVRFYDLYEKHTCHLNSSDILLAVPIQTMDGRDWKDPSVYNITARTCDRYSEHKNMFIIMPYNHDSQYNATVLDFIKEHGRNVILICGPIWTDTWEQSPLKPYIKKLLRVDMAIDSNDYPIVKKHFNQKGKRKFLYIGHTEYYKNTAQLEAIAKAIPGFEGGHIGRGEINGWKKISDGADLTPKFMGEIAKDYDIFLNTSKADAQATTILENMCFGFLVACTPESGYSYDSIIPLKIDDTDFNVKQIDYLQKMDEKELLKLTRLNREYAIKFHNWDIFCKKIINFIYENK